MANKLCKSDKKEKKDSDPAYICKSCGNVSSKEKKLCKPKKNK